MTDNEYIAPVKDDTLTVKDVFDRIAEFQKQMSESSFHSLHRLGEAISSMGEDEDVEDKAEPVEHICNVFIQRELTWQKMLSLYEKMYNNLIWFEKQSEKTPEETIISEMVEIIKNNPDPLAKGDAMSVLETYFEIHS